MALSFDGAQAKVDRGLEHLQSLDEEIQRVLNSQPYPVGAQYKAETAEIGLYALPYDFPLVAWGSGSATVSTTCAPRSTTSRGSSRSTS